MMLIRPKIENETLEDKLSRLKCELIREQHHIYHKDYHGNRHLRLKKHIRLLELGCDVEDDDHGLLVNNKFIVGIGTDKWCVVGRYKWYWYKSLQSFVEDYVNKDSCNDKMVKPNAADV